MVYVFLANGFEEVEALTAVDVLRRGGCDVKTVSIMETKTVTGAHDISVEADALFADEDYTGADMLILPGGLPGADYLRDHEGLEKALKKQNEVGGRIAAICAAPKVLGKHGLVQGKRATCYPGVEGDLIGADAVDDIVITDGNITTSRGPATAMAFALELVRLLKGEAVSDEVRGGLLYGMLFK